MKRPIREDFSSAEEFDKELNKYQRERKQRLAKLKVEQEQKESLSEYKFKPINYHKGHPFPPIGLGRKIIAIACDYNGSWECDMPKDYYETMSKIGWNSAEIAFHMRDGEVPVVFSQVGFETIVAGMVCQYGEKVCEDDTEAYVSYKDLIQCLTKVKEYSLETDSSVHMTAVGCGKGGADWGVVRILIEEILCREGIEVCVYTG